MRAIYTAVLVLMFSVSAGANWITEVIDDEINTGIHSSLVLDSSDFPHISHKLWKDNITELRYTYWDGTEWVIEIVDYSDTLSVGSYSKIVLDSSEYPHIVYVNTIDPVNYIREIMYAYWDGAQWNIEAVAKTGLGSVNNLLDIVLDSKDNLHLAYKDTRDQLHRSLKYAYFDGDVWDIETIADGGIGHNVSIDIDSLDVPHIGYYDGRLAYARPVEGVWEIDVIKQTGGFGVSMELDSSDSPHFAHSSYNFELLYSYWNGSFWQTNVAGTGNTNQGAICLALDSSDKPHIAHIQYPHPSDLIYTFKDDTGWESETLETTGVEWCSIDMSSSDYPHISYMYKTYYGNTSSVPADEWSVDPLKYFEHTNAYFAAYNSPDSYYNLKYTYWDPTGIEDGDDDADGSDIPYTFELMQNRPNPANNATTFCFALPETANAKLSIYDIKGRKMATVIDSNLPAGEHTVDYECTLSNGVYVYRLEAGGETAVRKLIVK